MNGVGVLRQQKSRLYAARTPGAISRRITRRLQTEDIFALPQNGPNGKNDSPTQDSPATYKHLT